MTRVQVTIKNVDLDAFVELKAEAARKKLHIGRALSLAIESWLSESKNPKRKLSEWKTIRGAKDTKHLSLEVDSLLYGE